MLFKIFPVTPVNGGWGQWTAWGQCNALRQRTRTRLCNTPLPQNGGLMCPGLAQETGQCPAAGRFCGSPPGVNDG